MSKLETSMEAIIGVFHSFASEDKILNEKTLNKKELKKLLEKELPSFLKTNPDIDERIIRDLDQNKDEKINFEEFVMFVAGLSTTCEKGISQNEQQLKGKLRKY